MRAGGYQILGEPDPETAALFAERQRMSGRSSSAERLVSIV